MKNIAHNFPFPMLSNTWQILFSSGIKRKRTFERNFAGRNRKKILLFNQKVISVKRNISNMLVIEANFIKLNRISFQNDKEKKTGNDASLKVTKFY